MESRANKPLIALACGGTGGHLFPGLAVADVLVQRGCRVALLVSPKEVDQQAVKSARGMQVVTIPAVGLSRGRVLSFVRGFAQSFRASRELFRGCPPQAVLAMGGFVSAPPILASKAFGAATFLHEANSIPGRANRLLAPRVDEAFVNFPMTAPLLRARRVKVVGMPVRAQFRRNDPTACRDALGLDPQRPLLLVMGGSQGASAINELVVQTVGMLGGLVPELQFLHLTGPNDVEKVRAAYAAQHARALVRPFLAEMDIALGAATVAVSRAGASSLAEFAATGLPAILVPYPSAAGNHQFFNARGLVDAGAARLLEQRSASPEKLTRLVVELVRGDSMRRTLSDSVARWHRPDAAEQIAAQVLAAVTLDSAATLGPRRNGERLARGFGEGDSSPVSGKVESTHA